MLFDDAVEGGLQHDDRQPDEADFGDVEAEGEHEKHGRDGLHNEAGGFLPGASCGFLDIVFDQNLEHGGRDRGTVAEPLKAFEQ